MTSFGFNLQLEEYSIDLALKAAKLTEDLGLQAVFVNDARTAGSPATSLLRIIRI